MSDKNKKTATTSVAVLQADYNTKLEVLNGLDETATDEVKAEAQTAVDEAKKLLDDELEKVSNASKIEIAKTGKSKLVKGRFLLSPTGLYNLAYNVGEEASLPELQAKELDEAGYFKISN